MKNLNFYTVSNDYVKYLQKAEINARGFSRVPNMEYGNTRKQKFLCGIVLQINGMDYYVPVSSYKQQKPDNFVIYAQNGRPTSSLRFNYMFPVPQNLLSVRLINSEPDFAYRALLRQELRFCIDNQERIRSLAERTYKRVSLGLAPGLVKNSCDFSLLEKQCLQYAKVHNLSASITEPQQNRPSVLEKLNAAKQTVQQRDLKRNEMSHVEDEWKR